MKRKLSTSCSPFKFGLAAILMVFQSTSAHSQSDVNVITFLEAVARVCGGSTSEQISTEGDNISLRTAEVTVDPGTGTLLVQKDGVLIATVGGEQSEAYYDCVRGLTESLGGEFSSSEGPTQSEFRKHFLFGLAAAVWDGELLYNCRIPGSHEGVSGFALGKTNLVFPMPGTEGWKEFMLGKRHQDAVNFTYSLSSAPPSNINEIMQNHMRGSSNYRGSPWVITRSLNDPRLQNAYTLGLEYGLADLAYGRLAKLTMALRTNRETGRLSANGEPLSGMPTGITPGIPVDDDGAPIPPSVLSNGVITPEDRDLLTRSHVCASNIYLNRKRRLETHLRTLGWDDIIPAIPADHNDIFLRHGTPVVGDFDSFDQRVAPYIESAINRMSS